MYIYIITKEVSTFASTLNQISEVFNIVIERVDGLLKQTRACLFASQIGQLF